MKRGAERQLTRDAGEGDNDEGTEPGQGLVKADDSVLATRKIRGLPKRATAGSSSGSAPPSAAPQPKFAGFAGFGTTATGTSPFSFIAQSKPAESPAPAGGSFLFNSSPSSTTPPVMSTSTAGPAVSSTASNATKTFASFLGSAAESKAPEPKPTNGIHAQNGAAPEDDKLKAETKYYRSLRGLNVSFVDAITKAVDSDPFLDLATVLEQYKSLRSKVREEYEQDIKKVSPSPTPAAASSSATSALSFGAKAGTTAPTPPAAPSSPFSFGAKPVAPSGSDSKAPPAMPAPPSGFAGFPAPAAPAASSSSTSTAGGFKPSIDLTKTSSFTFGSSSATSGSSSSAAPPKSAFTFGAPSSTTTSSASFSFPSSKPADSSSAAGPSIFSSNLFTTPTSDSSKDKEEKEKDAEKPSTTNTSNSIFGGGLAFGSDKPTLTSTPTKSGGGFTFSTPPPASKPAPFTFGAAAGSIGNPVGFGFGSPPRTPDAESKGFASAPKFGGFSFGAPPAPAQPAEATESGAGTDSSRGETPAEETPPLLSQPSAHDAEGEGEEDEETKYEIRTKVYRMVKKASGQSEWADVGIGMLRVKAHKETGQRRLLLRNSSTGKVTINFNVYKGMNPTVAKNVVSFMGHDEGNSVPFKLRVKTNEQADDLKKALDREIEFVKAKDSE